MSQHFYVPKQCRGETQPRIIFALDRGYTFVRTVLHDYKQITARPPYPTDEAPHEQLVDDFARKLITGAKACENYRFPDGRQQRHRYQWDGEKLSKIVGIPSEEVTG
ncbi:MULTISPECIES: hypothetical protein [unclassified Leclercia]|uniref:Uncharacterized protein n=1 Tax=Leclercia barmai TaxID=2785629 RepID=A0ABS7RT14_9ENTR|nr:MULTISPECIES: hypothetical protein [unclassified Leclercia]MBZ0057459.1 hypothetical protein [Leclercia sp. EMC7]MCM5695623.1 hypothetical protein [Leclercia sp. LTM01]MCM5700031.1 hypothetical protein [Leclercia sp. LTM14]